MRDGRLHARERRNGQWTAAIARLSSGMPHSKNHQPAVESSSGSPCGQTRRDRIDYLWGGALPLAQSGRSSTTSRAASEKPGFWQVVHDGAGNPEGALEYIGDIGSAGPRWPVVGGPIRQDQAIAMQLADALVAVAGAHADDLLCFEQGLVLSFV